MCEQCRLIGVGHSCAPCLRRPAPKAILGSHASFSGQCCRARCLEPLEPHENGTSSSCAWTFCAPPALTPRSPRCPRCQLAAAVGHRLVQRSSHLAQARWRTAWRTACRNPNSGAAAPFHDTNIIGLELGAYGPGIRHTGCALLRRCSAAVFAGFGSRRRSAGAPLKAAVYSLKHARGRAPMARPRPQRRAASAAPVMP
jgi:hypothetical protein